MARTRIILGYPDASKASTPFLVYAGQSGSAAEAAQFKNVTAHRFEIFEGPGRFKHNSRFNPDAKPPAATDSAPFTLPVPEEIKGMKKDDLIKALGQALKQNEQLQEAITKLQELQKPTDENTSANVEEGNEPEGE